MFKCPNPAHIVQIRDFSCKGVQSTDSFFFFQCLVFFLVWRVGVSLIFFPVVKRFFSQCLTVRQCPLSSGARSCAPRLPEEKKKEKGRRRKKEEEEGRRKKKEEEGRRRKKKEEKGRRKEEKGRRRKKKEEEGKRRKKKEEEGRRRKKKEEEGRRRNKKEEGRKEKEEEGRRRKEET